MARVPTVTGPTVALSAAPTVRQNISVSPESFGASTTFRQVGSDLTNIGDRINATAVRIAERQDADLVFQAETGLQTAWSDYQKSINQRKGVDAWGIHEQTKQWFDQNIKAFGAGLMNERQRALYNQTAIKTRLTGIDYAGRYEDDERQKSLVASNQARIDSNINIAAADPTAANVDNARSAIMRGVTAVGQLNGWAPEQVQTTIQESTGKLHTAILTSMLETDPLNAERYFEENKAEIPGTMQAGLAKNIRAGTSRVRAQSFADQVMASGMSQTQALADIRKNFDGEDEDTYVAEINRRFAEQEAARNRVEREASDMAWKELQRSGDINKIPTGVIAAMDPRAALALQNEAERRAAGKDAQTDWSLYYQLRRRAIEQPGTFAQEDLTKYFDHLGKAQRETLIDLQGAASKPEKMQDAASLSQQLSAAHDIMGWGTSDQEQKGKFDATVQNEIDAEQRAKGKTLTYQERQQVIDRMMAPGAVPGRLFGSNSRKYFETVGTPDQQNFTPTISDDDRQAIVNGLKAKGINNPSDDQVMRIYRRAKGL